jgi:hypothetical protein
MLAVYSLPEQGIIPAVRLGRRWIVTHAAFERWERTCGDRKHASLGRTPDVQ